MRQSHWEGALDLVGIHKINPLTGTVSSLVKEGLVDTKQSVQLAGTKYDEVIEAAAGMIISSGYVPSGIAMDPTLSFGLSTMRDANGRKIYPGNWIRTESDKFCRNDLRQYLIQFLQKMK